MIKLAGDDPWIEAKDDAAIAAILSSPNRWTKRGPATLLLTGTNTFPDGLLIREGIHLDGGTLEVNGSHFLPPPAPDAPAALILVAGPVIGTQTLSATNSGALISSLPAASSSIIGNSGLSTAFGPIAFDVADGDATADLVINAPVTGTSQAGLIKSGSGVLSLAGTNNYAGSTRVDSGTLELATSGALRFIRSATGAFNWVHGGGAPSSAVQDARLYSISRRTAARSACRLKSRMWR